MPPSTFDMITAIDTLHIAVDIMESLRQLIAVLKRGGRLGIFWESWIRSGTPGTYLEPRNTRLAHALNALGLSYDFEDFTESNNRLWGTVRETLEELKSEFEAEGNEILYESTLEEAKRIDWGIGARFLYIISP